ncbi:Geranylgeranyl transferase type-2 subunit alpha [Hondaea fermentalgiana]|uniref:Geranylgeranyl transferase type-2 subunit alpha n=1 Tax=Hondaea fermentalgiana TaxID=2315210 RepID=A0A2R5GUX9_9STRA|nr:Geranylgeranyl transferase type-2 subunit alpha [Hondaea fermentalgiana]|eukprot:GBG32463.1 Geranylgeranyl transferase type-2 subunit alpha [Hondaea fermentalgiana]
MHGRKQKDRALAEAEDPAKKAARAAKYAKLRSLLHTALECRAAHDTSDATMTLCGELLCINPSINTLWNVRRDGLLARIRAAGEKDETAAQALREDLCKQELELNRHALVKGNVKSHEGWSHRAWIVEVLGEDGSCINVDRELMLCDQLLAADERNFHCFQYRRVLARIAKHGPDDDLRFAEGLVERNFSNYSAWHLRIKALEARPDHLRAADLEEEFGLVCNALFTEPDDSSGWMYHRWLVGQLQPRSALDDEVDRRRILQDQVATCTELNEMEGGESKWALLGLCRLYELGLRHYADLDVLPPGTSAGSLCAALKSCDPGHAVYYHHLEAKLTSMK